MAEEYSCVSKKTSFSVLATLKSLFFNIIAALQLILHYILNLEGKSRTVQLGDVPQTFAEAKDRVRWRIINYLKETRIWLAIVHITNATKGGDCSHPVTKESILLEMRNISETRKKVIWLCVDYIKSLMCGLIVYFATTVKTVYENEEPVCIHQTIVDPTNSHAHKSMEKISNNDKESVEIIADADADAPGTSSKSTEQTVFNPRMTLSVRKSRKTANQQLSTTLTHKTLRSVYNSDGEVSSGSDGIQMSASYGTYSAVNLQSNSSVEKTVTSDT